MAGKGRRTASRQAELNRKRKRTTKGPSGIPGAVQEMGDPDDQELVAVSAGAVDAGLEGSEALESTGTAIDEIAATPRAARPSPMARTPRGEFAGQSQLRGDRPAAYLYVGAELRRIMLLAGALLAALIVLGILL